MKQFQATGINDLEPPGLPLSPPPGGRVEGCSIFFVGAGWHFSWSGWSKFQNYQNSRVWTIGHFWANVRQNGIKRRILGKMHFWRADFRRDGLDVRTNGSPERTSAKYVHVRNDSCANHSANVVVVIVDPFWCDFRNLFRQLFLRFTWAGKQEQENFQEMWLKCAIIVRTYLI